MPNPDYSTLVAQQREFFLSGATRPIEWRKAQLEALKAMLIENHDELCDALWKDLRRNVFDADLMDVASSEKEADHALRHLEAWTTPERVHTPLVLEPGHVRVRRDPFGVSLIIGAWNEPFMLLFHPLVAALAAGNTAVLKPSEIAVACSVAAAKLTPKYFDPRAVAVRGRRRTGNHRPARGEVGLHLLHPQPSGGQDGSPGGGKKPDALRAGIGRQEPHDRAFFGQPEIGGKPHRLWALHELRTHLHRAGPRPRLARGKRCVRPASRGDDPRVLWRRAKIESGLRPGDQRQELRSTRSADGQR